MSLLPSRATPATSSEHIFMMGAVVAVLGAYLNLEDHNLSFTAGKHPLVRVQHNEYGSSLSFRVLQEPADLMIIGKVMAWQAIERDVERVLAIYIETIDEKERENVHPSWKPGRARAVEEP